MPTDAPPYRCRRKPLLNLEWCSSEKGSFLQDRGAYSPECVQAVFSEVCIQNRAYLPLRRGLAQGPSQRCGDGGESDCDQHRCSQREHKPGNRHPDGPFVEH